MGASRTKRLAYQRTHGGAVPPPAPPLRARQFTLVLLMSVYEDLEREYEAFKKRQPDTDLGLDGYAAALLEASVERERQAREREATKDNLIVPAMHLPPGIEQAAARLAAIKKGVA